MKRISLSISYSDGKTPTLMAAQGSGYIGGHLTFCGTTMEITLRYQKGWVADRVL